MRSAAILGTILTVLGAAACGSPGPTDRARSVPAPLALGAASYDDPNAEKPRIRWGDGPTSLNDRCIVRKNKLNLRMPPIFVNGQPIGFC